MYVFHKNMLLRFTMTISLQFTHTNPGYMKLWNIISAQSLRIIFVTLFTPQKTLRSSHIKLPVPRYKESAMLQHLTVEYYI